jgi:DNA polymerase III alpha subunit
VAKVKFPCGCEFERLDGDENHYVNRVGEPLPLLKYDVYTDSNLKCPITWELAKEGKTIGVFQLESQLGRMWAKRIEPDDLEIHGALTALLRPGCLRAVSGKPPKSMTDRYKDRRKGTEDVEFFGVKELKPILSPTYGVLVYQEQAMKIAVVLAGFNEQEADILRKAIGKKKPEIMSKVEGDFLEGCKKVGLVDEEKAKEIFGWIRESQRYSFNKSHAITYGKDSFWSLYCKAHFPVQFYCSYMRGAGWKQDQYDEINTLVSDAKTYGINVHCPDFRDQEPLCYIKDNAIYFGLLDIRDVGEAAIEKMKIQVREVELLLNKKTTKWTWLDYLIYFSPRISLTTNKSLINSGALDFFKMARAAMMFEYEKFILLTDKEQLWIYSHQYGQFNGNDKITPPKWNTFLECMVDCGKTKKEGGGCHNSKRVDIVKSISQQLNNPPHNIEDTADRIVWGEERYLGTSITMSIVDGCEDSFKANITCHDASKPNAPPYMIIAAEIIRVNEHSTKKGKNPGQKMGFLTVRDKTAILDNIVCFPETWKVYKDTLFEQNTVLLRIDKTKAGSFAVQKVAQI